MEGIKGKMAKWLERLAGVAGIASSYVDKMRVVHETSFAVYRKFLSFMGYDVSSEKSCRAEYEQEMFNLYSRGIGYSCSVFGDKTVLIKLWVPETEYVYGMSVCFSLCYEDSGNDVDGVCDIVRILKCDDNVCYRNAKGKRFFEYNFRLWNVGKCGIKVGYYIVKVKYADKICESFLIVAPDKAYLPKVIEENKKLLGVGLQLYGLKSNRNFGIGDFGDLVKILPVLKDSGCSLVGINPLGPMYAGGAKDVSPYRTLSREYVNYLYIDLRREMDFKKSKAVQNLMKKPAFLQKIKKIQQAEFIDYSLVFDVKLSLLRLMYKYFYTNEILVRSKRALDFKCFKEGEGKSLMNLCLYEALLEDRVPNSDTWGSGLDDCESLEVKKWSAKHKTKVDFYAYVHWIAERQLKDVQDSAKNLGMNIGMYLDIPVGAASDGVEVWQDRKLYAKGADVGAPPDTIRPKGQTWGLCPPIPLEQSKSRYVAFRRMIVKNMQYAGAVRIDHSFSLSRLFWVAGGDGAKCGAYVNYNFKDLVAIVCLESWRNKCLVIGEDLGNAPAGFTSVMKNRAIFGNRVLYRRLPKNDKVEFANLFPYYSLCQVGTHDQATSCGFWVGEDIERNRQCGLYPQEEQYLANLKKREKERVEFFELFSKMGAFETGTKLKDVSLFNDSKVSPKGVEYSFNICGAMTDSAIFLVRADDIYAGVVMQNVPGTVDEYPNWRVRFPVSIDEMLRDGKISKFFNVLKKYRK